MDDATLIKRFRARVQKILELVGQAGCGRQGWSIMFDETLEHPDGLGVCYHNTRCLRFSLPWLRSATDQEQWRLVTHEIAHCQTQFEAEDHGPDFQEQWAILYNSADLKQLWDDSREPICQTT